MALPSMTLISMALTTMALPYPPCMALSSMTLLSMLGPTLHCPTLHDPTLSMTLPYMDDPTLHGPTLAIISFLAGYGWSRIMPPGVSLRKLSVSLVVLFVGWVLIVEPSPNGPCYEMSSVQGAGPTKLRIAHAASLLDCPFPSMLLRFSPQVQPAHAHNPC